MIRFANAFADALHKNAARIIMIFLLFCVSAAGIIFDMKHSAEKTEGIPVSADSSDKTEVDGKIIENPDGILEITEPADIRIPHCDSIYCSVSGKESDFSFKNPETNECYLKVSVTRRDTSETIYTSTLISPGKSIENISFTKGFSASGAYEAMVKVDAYSQIGFTLLNSLVMKTEITVY